MLDLMFFDKYQGKILTLHDAEEIANNQQKIITTSFIQGFNYINEGKSTHLAHTFVDYINNISEGLILSNPSIFRQKQEKLYHLIHSSNINCFYKIFFEYLIGLSRFTLGIQLLFTFIKHLTKNQKDKNLENLSLQLFNSDKIYSLSSYFDRLATISEVGKTLLSYLSDYYFLEPNNSENFWEGAENYFLENQDINSLAKDLVSIQYVPRDKRYLGIMQAIHWRGFGGSGEMLLQFDPLKNLVAHSISHHDDYDIGKNLSKRLNAFRLPLFEMLSKSQKTITSYLNNHFPEDELNIYDFCSGPKLNAVRGIIESLETLGLVLYLQELVTNLSHKINLILQIDPAYQKKDIFTEVQIYRVIQEFTTNVMKHSNANEVVVYIRNHQKYLTMILSDNGQSFDYEKGSKGMGIKNIESRISSVKGFYKWKNKIGIGSRLIINIPN